MRLQPNDRKNQILIAALEVAGRPNGWATLTREAVAKEANCAESLVSRYFGTMNNFRRAIMRAAINDPSSKSHLRIVGQGLAAGDKCAKKAPADIRSKAITQLVGE